MNTMGSASEGRTNNPLLHWAGTREPGSFDELEARHVQPAMTQLLAEAKQSLLDIGQLDQPPTWNNVYEALEIATEPLEIAYALVTHLETVRTTPDWRAAYNTIKPEVSAFFASIPFDEGLYARLSQLQASEEAKLFRPDQKRALSQTLAEFERQGAGLEPQSKQRLEALTRELAAYTAKYAQNVLDDTAAWTKHITSESSLLGLPEAAKQQAQAEAEKRGKKGWVLTLQAPSFVPALTYLDSSELREEIYRAYYSRASKGEKDNSELISKILLLRKRQADLLGYKNFVDYVLEPRMAKNALGARSFIKDLTKLTQPEFEREVQELKAFYEQETGQDPSQLKPWDLNYYAEKLRKARFDFDEEELRPYFEVSKVTAGLFEIAERVFGVNIRPNNDLPGWHADVKAFSLVEGGRELGHFYIDLHPREDKRGGAWMMGLSSGVLQGEFLDRPHLGLFAANVTKPIKGQPALLNHREVETLFHEFGHLLHHLLSKVQIRGQAGTQVAWDFVELPSQLLENWCWSREALDLFARHYETNEPIPDALFDKMQATRTFRSASFMMRQLGFAEVDLALHLDFDDTGGQSKGPVEFARDVIQAFSPAPLYEQWAFINGFTHLFASAVGYAAGYYSYKWAEVLDADAFTQFEVNPLSSDVGERFRREILEKGDSVAPEDLFKAFMGRPPQLEALLIRSGLQVAA